MEYSSNSIGQHPHPERSVRVAPRDTLLADVALLVGPVDGAPEPGVARSPPVPVAVALHGVQLRGLEVDVRQTRRGVDQRTGDLGRGDAGPVRQRSCLALCADEGGVLHRGKGEEVVDDVADVGLRRDVGEQCAGLEVVTRHLERPLHLAHLVGRVPRAVGQADRPHPGSHPRCGSDGDVVAALHDRVGVAPDLLGGQGGERAADGVLGWGPRRLRGARRGGRGRRLGGDGSRRGARPERCPGDDDRQHRACCRHRQQRRRTPPTPHHGPQLVEVARAYEGGQLVEGVQVRHAAPPPRSPPARPSGRPGEHDPGTGGTSRCPRGRPARPRSRRPVGRPGGAARPRAARRR